MQDKELQREMSRSKKIYKLFKDVSGKREIVNADLEIIFMWSLDLVFSTKVNAGTRLDLQQLISFILKLSKSKVLLIDKLKEFVESLTSEKFSLVLGWEEDSIQGLINQNFTKIFQKFSLELEEKVGVAAGLGDDSRGLLRLQKDIYALVIKFKARVLLEETIDATLLIESQLWKILNARQVLKENQKLAGILIIQLMHSDNALQIDLIQDKMQKIENEYSILSLWRGILLLNSKDILDLNLELGQLWEVAFTVISRILENSQSLVHTLAIQTLSDWFIAAQEYNIETQVYQTINSIIEKLQLPFENVKEQVVKNTLI